MGVFLKKRKILISITIILIIALGSFYGIYSASADNIKNRVNENQHKSYKMENLLLDGWQKNEEGYVSTTDAQSVEISKVNCFVNNIYFNGTIKKIEDVKFRIYYTTNKNEEFAEEKSFMAQVSVKGQKKYFSLNKDVVKLRIQFFESPGLVSTMNGFEVNPQSLNFSFGSVFSSISILTMLATLVGMLLIKNKMNLTMITFKKYQYLLKNLISRDLKVKYRRSVLGILWSVLNPLLMMLVITAVFKNIFRLDVPNFAEYYLTGALIFNFVSEATSTSMNSVIGAAALIKKVYIPKYIFPIEKCLFAFVNMVFSLIAVAVVFLILQTPLHWTIFLFPIPMIYTFVFSLGLSLILSAANVFFRDIGHLYGVWITAWLYFTPIIYPITVLPEFMQTLVKLNPLYYYVNYFRDVMLYGNIPTLQDNIICIGFSLITLLLGLVIFKKKQDKFILYI